MKKLYFILIGLFFLSHAIAQVNCKAIQGYAYSITTLPGTLRVDENGVPLPVRVNKERLIYFFTSCKIKPTINKVLYGKTIVKADVNPTAEVSFSAVKSSDQKSILLKPRRGSFLWKINIIENAGRQIPEINNVITVTGMIGAKRFFIVIKEEVELQGHETY